MMNKQSRILLFAMCVIMMGMIASCQPQALNGTNPLSTQELPVAPEPTNTPIPTAAPTAVPTPSAEEIHSSIVNALLELYLTPNRMDVSTALGDGQIRTSVIEFVPPDRKHLVDLDENVEYIVIGEMVYAKTGTSGAWEETQIPASSFMEEEEVTAQKIGETISDAQWIGTDTYNGLTVIVYKYNSTTKSGDIEMHSQTELWVAESDGLPVKMIIDGEILSASVDPDTGESKLQAVPALTTTLIEFDLTLSIEAPIP